MTFTYRILISLNTRKVYQCIESFDDFPPTSKSYDHDKKVFKPALKGWLITQSFCSVNDVAPINKCQYLYIFTCEI